MPTRWKNAAGAALLALCAAPAGAQDNLQLYGRFDAGLGYTSAVRGVQDGAPGAAWRAQSGNWGASWLGLKGTEQLGDGDAAFFELEAGIDLMHGSGNAGADVLWGRKAYLGYRSRDWGELKLGRDLSMGNYQWDMDPMMQELYSSTSLMRWRNSLVINNAIGYQSPVWHGLDVSAQYAPGEQAGGVGQGLAAQSGRSDALQITYTDARLELRAQWDALRDGQGRFSNLFTASRTLFAGAAVKLDATTTVMAGYNHLSAADTPAGLADTAQHYWFGAKVQATPQWLLSGGGYRIQVSGGAGDATHDGAGHATLLAAGAMYALSKNTFWYLSLAHVRNGATSNFGVGARNPGSDNHNLDNPPMGGSQSGLYTGINASF